MFVRFSFSVGASPPPQTRAPSTDTTQEVKVLT
jgi:hypothetical protein